ncbi:MAG: site-specific integrase [Roseibacillus sp.]
MSSPDANSLLEQFYEFLSVEKNVSPRTLANYERALVAFREWMADHFASWRDCTPDQFRAYLFDCMKRELARSTIRLHFSALRAFYKFLVFRHGFPKSPVAEVNLPKLERQLPVVLTLALIEQLLEAKLNYAHREEFLGEAQANDMVVLQLGFLLHPTSRARP